MTQLKQFVVFRLDDQSYALALSVLRKPFHKADLGTAISDVFSK